MLLIIALLTALGAIGCKKKTCYHCYYFWGGFTAIKNGDSISVGIVPTSTRLHDSINYYVNLGYTIDSVRSRYVPDPGNGAEVCDTNEVYNGQPVRDTCGPIIM